MPAPRRRLGSLVIRGEPVTKKNSQVPVWQGFPHKMGPGLRDFHRRLLAYIESGAPGAAVKALRWVIGEEPGSTGLRPIILPSEPFRRWAKTAVPQLRSQWVGRPAVGGPAQHLHVVGHWYLARMGERMLGGDVAAFYQALGDVLEDAEVVSNDAFIRSWAGSDFVRCPADPRVELTIYETVFTTHTGQGVLEI